MIWCNEHRTLTFGRKCEACRLSRLLDESFKYISDAKRAAREFNYTGRPLPEIVDELYKLVRGIQ